MINGFKKEIDYIMSAVNQSLDIVPSGTVTGDFDEFTTSPSRLSASVGEAAVRLLGIRNGRSQELVKEIWAETLKVTPSFKLTLYDNQMFGSTTPSMTTCPARYV